jgi:hypothetical protein
MNRVRPLLNALCVAGVGALLSGSVAAAVTAQEAEALGTTLTEFGAEKGANADGSIPAYTGGLKSVSGYTAGADRYIDPFKDEKPLFSVDASNAAQYDAMLTESTRALIKKFPDYRIDVYPSHRTMYYPQWQLDNTKKNATTAKLVGAVKGDSLSGAAPDGLPFAGIPFPIPKDGYEVMWNDKMPFGAAVHHQKSQAYLIDTGGGVTALPVPDEYFVYPWSDKDPATRAKTFDATFGFYSLLTAPPASAGIVFLNWYLPTAVDEGQKVWFYTPGQRRVRRAPEFAYDIPIAAYGGCLVWDEIFGFVGRLDRYDFSLVGKKEMLIPYNVFKVTNTMPAKETLGKYHMKPEALRFEKHRVWVVEANLKPGARHAYKKRRFYIDEDSWNIVSLASWDEAGNLWRVADIWTFPTYDVGGVNNTSWTFNDLIKGNYFIINMGHADQGFFVKTYATAAGLPIKLTADAVAAGSVR